MGASSSTENLKDQVHIPKEAYITKLKYYEFIEKTATDLELKCKQLEEELIETKKQASAKEQSLQKYESLPILKTILDTITAVKELQEQFKNYRESNVIDETIKIQNEIQQLTGNVNRLWENIDKDVIDSFPIPQRDEVLQVDDKIKSLSRNRANDRDEKLEKMSEELGDLSKKIELEIPELLGRILKDVEAKRSLFDQMGQEKVDPTYHEIKSILVRQENALLKYQLSTPKQDTLKKDIPKKNAELLGYNLIFGNVPEDDKSDYEHVKMLLELIGICAPPHLPVRRIGQPLNDQPKLLKVIFPSKRLVRVIWENRRGFRPTTKVFIRPDKYENQV